MHIARKDRAAPLCGILLPAPNCRPCAREARICSDRYRIFESSVPPVPSPFQPVHRGALQERPSLPGFCYPTAGHASAHLQALRFWQRGQNSGQRPPRQNVSCVAFPRRERVRPTVRTAPGSRQGLALAPR